MKKYTAKIKQAQYVGKVKILPTGGELTEAQVNQILNDPYGKDLIQKKILVIEGLKEGTKAEPNK